MKSDEMVAKILGSAGKSGAKPLQYRVWQSTVVLTYRMAGRNHSADIEVQIIVYDFHPYQSSYATNPPSTHTRSKPLKPHGTFLARQIKCRTHFPGHERFSFLSRQFTAAWTYLNCPDTVHCTGHCTKFGDREAISRWQLFPGLRLWSIVLFLLVVLWMQLRLRRLLGLVLIMLFECSKAFAGNTEGGTVLEATAYEAHGSLLSRREIFPRATLKIDDKTEL